MKRSSVTLPEIIQTLCFLIYLFGSSLTLIEHGTELSLWIMALAVLISASTTILPWLGIQWLQMKEQGSQVGRWVSLLLQTASWGTFAFAMLMRLGRNLPHFYRWIVITTLLWATWLLVYIFSRYVCSQRTRGDKLKRNESFQKPSEEEGKTP